MFEWLVNEMGTVNTKKFFVVDGLPDDKHALVKRSELPVPPSYKDFVLQFGHARLYRGPVDQYRVEVFADLRAVVEEGEPLLHFGRTDRSLAYFKEELLAPEAESPVFEWQHRHGTLKIADSFHEWLSIKCKWAKGTFTKKEWQAIEAGPPPFNSLERQVIEARPQFRWRVIGINMIGNIQFEVYNGSNMVIPFLSIGICGKRRGTNEMLHGGIWLPVGTILPGQTAVVEKDCYKKWVDPQDVNVFKKPDPEPEDRERYWEFRALH